MRLDERELRRFYVVELATLAAALPAGEKRNVALLVAFRPWVFSMFSALGAPP